MVAPVNASTSAGAGSEAPNHSAVSLGPCSSARPAPTQPSHLILICELRAVRSVTGPESQDHRYDYQTLRVDFILPSESALFFPNKNGTLE